MRVCFLLLSILIMSVQLTAQDNCKIYFNGDWSFDHKFEAFEGFTTAYNRYYNYNEDGVSKGEIKIIIEDQLHGGPDPSPEQMATLQFICDNQDYIRSVLLDTSVYDFQDYLYEIIGGEFLTNRELENLEPLNMKNLMSPEELYIHSVHKDGYAYFGIEGYCVWEADEGFGFLFHKKRILEADVSFVATETGPIEADLGYEIPSLYDSLKSIKQYGNKIEPKPKLITPHPKYGKLKPTEVCENQLYVNKLISYGHIEEVISLHQQKAINIQDSISQYSVRDLLTLAVQFNQKELVEYFLDNARQPLDLRNALGSAAKNYNREFVELLLARGADLNALSRRHGMVLDQVIPNYRRYKASFITVQEEEKEVFIEWLRSKGAITSLELFDSYYKERNFKELTLFLESSSRSTLHKRLSELLKENLKSGDEEMAIFLFKHLHCRNSYKKSWLREAVDLEDKLLVEYCLEQGAEFYKSYPKDRPYFRRTILDIVQEKIERGREDRLAKLKEIESYLISHGAKTYDELINEVFDNSDEVIKDSLALHIERNRKQADLSVLIEKSIKRDKIDLAKYFLDLPNLNSARMKLAILSGSQELVTYMLDQGIDINYSSFWVTPFEELMHKVERDSTAYSESYVNWLKSKGASDMDAIVERFIKAGQLDSIINYSPIIPYERRRLSRYLSIAVKYDQDEIADHFYNEVYSPQLPFAAIELKDLKLLDYFLAKGISHNHMFYNRSLIDDTASSQSRNPSPEDITSLNLIKERLLSLGAQSAKQIVLPLIKRGDIEAINQMFEQRKLSSHVSPFSHWMIKGAFQYQDPEFAFETYRNIVMNPSQYLHSSVVFRNIQLTDYILNQGYDINKLDYDKTVLDKLENLLKYWKDEEYEEGMKLYDWLVSKGAKKRGGE